MKFKIKKLFMLMLLIVVSLFSFSGCTSCARAQWEQVYDVYSKEEGKFFYQSFNATITEETFAEMKKGFQILIDYDDFFEKYHNYSNVQAAINVYQSHFFYFVDDSIEILVQSGFFNDINENTVITFTVNNYIGWDGWQYPVFEVKVNDKTYLDFETGYKNVINFIKAKIDNL